MTDHDRQSCAPHIVCIGEALIEMVKVELDSPHDQLGHYEGPFASGAPAILAAAAGRLAKARDLRVGFIGTVGADAFGDVFVRELEASGVDTTLVGRSPTLATGIAFVQLNADGSRSFVFSRGAAADVRCENLDPAYFADVRAIHISGSSLALDERLREACIVAMELALSANPACLVTFDPNFRAEMADPRRTMEWSGPVLGRATHLLPSGDELAFLTGHADVRQACKMAFHLGPRLEGIVRKQGRLGCTVLTRRNLEDGGAQIAAFDAQERHPTGAGDNFGGAFLVAMLAGHHEVEAARFACAAGSLAVERKGLMKAFGWSDVVARMSRY